MRRINALSQAQGATLPNFDADVYESVPNQLRGVMRCAGCLDWVYPTMSATVGVDVDVYKVIRRVNRESPT